MAALLRIRLLGEPDFRVDEDSHPFEAPPRTLPLLVYLLLHRESRLNREAVANLLWPDCAQAEARSNLRRHLHYIKRALPPLPQSETWLDVSKTAVRWNPSVPYWLDIAEFELSSKCPERREQGAALYRADLFERCADEWIIYHRERLRNMQIANLCALADAAKDAGRLDAAIAYAAQLLAIDPWRENTVRTLMELRAQNGDRAGALSEHDRLRERLRNDLDVEPMPETAALYRRLRGTQPIERRAEMEALERSLRDALHADPDMVLAGGEAEV